MEIRYAVLPLILCILTETGLSLQVVVSERNGQNGRGLVLQDVHALPEVCMDRIRDLSNYPNMVPKG
jgi:hypothetical protein